MSNCIRPYGVNYWKNSNDGLIDIYANGLPFMVNRGIDGWTGLSYDETGLAEVNGGWKVKYLCLLGNISTYDKGTGSWFSKRGDMSKEQFIGDRLGTVEVVYNDGSMVTVPLIFGFTLWWDSPLRMNVGHGPYHEPFASDENSRETLEKSLYLNKFRPEYESENYEPGMSYCSVISLEDKQVDRIRLYRDKSFFGEPLYIGITVLSDQNINDLHEFPDSMKEVDLSNKKIITSGILNESFYKPRIKELQKTIYTFKEDCDKDFEIDIPENFNGPSIKFNGSRYAQMLTNIYYHNLHDLLMKTDWRNHMTPTSTPKAPAWGEYTDSIGTWRNNVGRGNNKGYAGIWSRDGARAGIERRKFGLGYLTTQEIRFFDRRLYTATPPHWTRDITNLFNGHSRYDKRTVDGIRIIGVMENDGHGSVMLLRYTDWLYSTDKQKWFEEFWQATVDSSEWVCWLMDHKISEDQPEDVIWSVTEPSGYNGVEIYSNVICLYGLMSSIIIASDYGQDEYVKKWGNYTERLFNGIKKQLVVNKNNKNIWKAHENSSWQDLDEALAPVFQAAELYGYSLEEYPFDEEWLNNSLNTYFDRILSEPKYNHGRAFGYGFGYIAQTALLLDKMDDVNELTERICDYAYFSKVSPWIVPEGVVVHPSGEYWYRTGDHGNTAQQVEIIKMIRLMLGIDDSSNDTLRIIPRIPECIEGVEVTNFKVRNTDGNLVEVSYYITINDKTTIFSGDFTKYNGRLKIRLKGCSDKSKIKLNNVHKIDNIKITCSESGWYWVEFNGTNEVITLYI